MRIKSLDRSLINVEQVKMLVLRGGYGVQKYKNLLKCLILSALSSKKNSLLCSTHEISTYVEVPTKNRAKNKEEEEAPDSPSSPAARYSNIVMRRA